MVYLSREILENYYNTNLNERYLHNLNMLEMEGFLEKSTCIRELVYLFAFDAPFEPRNLDFCVVIIVIANKLNPCTYGHII